MSMCAPWYCGTACRLAGCPLLPARNDQSGSGVCGAVNRSQITCAARLGSAESRVSEGDHRFGHSTNKERASKSILRFLTILFGSPLTLTLFATVVPMPTSAGTSGLQKCRHKTPEICHISCSSHHYVRASGNIPGDTVAKVAEPSTMSADRGKVECYSTMICTCFSSLVLFRLRDVSHPAEEAFVRDAIEKGSDCLRSPTSTLPVQYVYPTPISIVFTRSYVMSSTVSPAACHTILPSILNVEFFFLATKACNGQSPRDESTAGH